ncbi:hypothetical protein HUT19_20105 [Streptomyces sp. NA02950]|uniref:hypothetical protein n=1 Tax=Streptomyces sp. NA02950 TaxID=2742137 RepID=UPI001591C1F0|nr:hypothetical protein [Streptomyces sp. NA02950]QKV93775.1 hypothetical protein HUT19_20105 [Streptomyces sp. NA02950]
MRDRSRVSSGLAAVAALCAVAMTQGQALAAPADLSAGPRGYDAQGTRIRGAGDAAGAPALDAGRTYTDSVGPGEKRYYAVGLDAKSAAYVSAVAAPQPGSGVTSFRDGVRVTLQNPDGGTCDTASPRIEGNGGAYPLADHVVRQIDTGSLSSCRTAGRYLVTVERQAGAQDSARWPLELRLMVEPPVKGGSTGGTPEGSWRTDPPRPPSGTPRHHEGGRRFGDAPTVSTGVWRDDFRPGETHFYRVPVDWGQQLSAVAELPADSEDKSSGLLDKAVSLRAYTPALGLAKRGTVGVAEGKSPGTEVSTAPVAYGNRYGKADYSVRAMSVAGGYYLAVTLSPTEVAPHVKGTVPVTLRVRVAGAARGGPNYQGDALKQGFGLTDADKKAARQGALSVGDDAMSVPAEDGTKSTLRMVGWTGLGAGTVLLAGLGTWTLTARRRTAAGEADETPFASLGDAGGTAAGASGTSSASGVSGPSGAGEPSTGQQLGYGPPSGW